MRGRPPKPEPLRGMRRHRVKGRPNAYAATRVVRVSPRTGKAYYAYIHWGTVDDNNVFYPSRKWVLLPEAERALFEYPENWDMSAANRMLREERDRLASRTEWRKARKWEQDRLTELQKLDLGEPEETEPVPKPKKATAKKTAKRATAKKAEPEKTPKTKKRATAKKAAESLQAAESEEAPKTRKRATAKKAEEPAQQAEPEEAPKKTRKRTTTKKAEEPEEAPKKTRKRTTTKKAEESAEQEAEEAPKRARRTTAAKKAESEEVPKWARRPIRTVRSKKE